VSTRVREVTGLAADPALPRRDDLLDDAVVGSRLAEVLPRTPGVPGTATCTRVRAKYRVGESLRATFRVADGTVERLVSARMFGSEEAADAQLLRARVAAAAAGASPDSVLLDRAMRTVFWVFPQDRKLPGLRHLTEPPAALRHVFGAPWVHSELMAYTPEKAATVRCADGSGSTVGFAKVQGGDDGRRSVATLRAARRGLADTDGLHLPDAVGYVPVHHMALFTVAPGRPLSRLPRAEVPRAMSALGAAVSRLHRQPTNGFGPFTRLDPRGIAGAGAVVTAARPDLARLTNTVVDTLLATRPPTGPTALLHGDLHPKNVLVHAGGVSLVDLDQAGTGPAAAELGGVLARLWCPRPGDPIDPDTAATAAGALLDAYDRPPSTEDLVWFAAAALLVERAVRAISRVDLDGIAALERVLATAGAWLRDLEVPS
jgi:aminoglycoside phosphotransferase